MTETQIRKCHERLERFLVDLLEPVGRSERHWGAVYVRGLLLNGERKSIEPMASRLPDGNIQAMQQFIGQSPWDWPPIWERLGRRMTAELEPESAWAIDDTGFPKQGDHSAAQTFPYWWPIPRALSDELLHGLNVSIGQTRRHRFNRLALAVQQQAAHVNGAPMPPLATTNRLQQIN